MQGLSILLLGVAVQASRRMEISQDLLAVVSGSPDVSNSFVFSCSNSVSQSGWWCPALPMSPIHVSSLVARHVSPCLAGGVGLSGHLQFISFPL